MDLVAGVLVIVAPPLERLHWISPLDSPHRVAVYADKEDVGILEAGVDKLQLCLPWQLWLLGVGNGLAGDVEAGLLEEPTVNR